MKHQNHEKWVVYAPRQRQEMGWIQTWLHLSRNAIAYRELIWQLFRRDFFRPYRKSFIGVGWIFISPVLGIVSWTFMALSGVLRPGDIGVPYPVYVLIGSSLWGLFRGFYSAASSTIGAGGGFILQVNYPHDVLLVKTTGQTLVNFAIVFVLNLIILTVAGYPPHWETILLPLMILPLFFGAAALGLLSAVLNEVMPDLPRFTNMFFSVLFYLTPIIYSSKTQNHFVNAAIKLNPMTYLIGGARDLIIFGRFDHWSVFLFCSLVLFASFLIALRLFFVAELKVIERV